MLPFAGRHRSSWASSTSGGTEEPGVYEQNSQAGASLQVPTGNNRY